RGPWTPDALHGGPVAALLAGAVEAVPAADPVQVTRLTVELLRPVPLAPLLVSTSVARPGRKVQVVEATVSDGERPLAWARALRLRLQDPDGSGLAAPGGPGGGGPPGPDAGYATEAPIGAYRAFHNAGAELRYVRGSFATIGPATVWVRLAVPVVAGTAPSPLQRAAAAADFGNGVSAELDFTSYLFLNPDLTVYLVRPVRGEWVCLDAATRLGTPGVAVAESTLSDADGPVGRALQSLLVEPRS
ncbi:MAG TPA: thioesterase family protein, partial [Acidimicrobiales bacterium]|nr:thioesterase family protein [Acidimicrobiales bacterium]